MPGQGCPVVSPGTSVTKARGTIPVFLVVLAFTSNVTTAASRSLWLNQRKTSCLVGITSVPWTGSNDCQYHPDPNAFLFSLTNNFKHTQILGSESYSTLHCAPYGPTFGSGHDFYTDLKSNVYTSLGNTYVCRTGSAGTNECNADFTGSGVGQNLQLMEMEVYTEF
jgi:TLD protein